MKAEAGGKTQIWILSCGNKSDMHQVSASASVPKADSSDICRLDLHAMVQVNQFRPQPPPQKMAGIGIITETCKQEKTHELGYF